MFWFRYVTARVTADRGTEMSQVVHTFRLSVAFDADKSEEHAFERELVEETTAIWRAIEGHDIWGSGVGGVWVEGIDRLDEVGGDVVSQITIKAMVDETGGTMTFNGEQPMGAIDGINAVFVLSHVPMLVSLLVFRNGLLMQRGTDFTISGATITFTTPPVAGSTILATYVSVG
jgi:hypothetical protein